MAANANVAAMNVNPIVLHPQSKGKLPAHLSSEEEAEACHFNCPRAPRFHGGGMRRLNHIVLVQRCKMR